MHPYRDPAERPEPEEPPPSEAGVYLAGAIYAALLGALAVDLRDAVDAVETSGRLAVLSIFAALTLLVVTEWS